MLKELIRTGCPLHLLGAKKVVFVPLRLFSLHSGSFCDTCQGIESKRYCRRQHDLESVALWGEKKPHSQKRI